MPQPGLQHPESLPLQQTIADLYLLRGHSNTVLAQSLWVPGSWCAQSLLEPSERLWWEWGLILNANSPLLPSSPLALDIGYLLTAAPALHSHCSSTYHLARASLTWTWGISSGLLQRHAATAINLKYYTS